MPFTVSDFHDTVDSDLWVLQRMMTLPSDPPPRTGKSGSVHTLYIQRTLSMGDQRKAVEDYRRDLLPAMFIVAQKVYAEFFHLVIGNAGLSVGNGQKNVQDKVSQLMGSGSLIISPPFSDYNEFKKWWSGQYSFDKLRIARNRVVHGGYTFNGSELRVEGDRGTVLLHWNEVEILDFCSSVLIKGQSI